MHCCRSAPVSPTHWLGVAPLAEEPPPEALLPELSLPPEELLLLGELLLGELLLPPDELPLDPLVESELPPLLGLPPLMPAPEPDDPELPPVLPAPCAHAAVPKLIMAAVTAALIIFTIMVEIPLEVGNEKNPAPG